MSWATQRGGGTSLPPNNHPPPPPQQSAAQMLNSNQHSNQENQWRAPQGPVHQTINYPLQEFPAQAQNYWQQPSYQQHTTEYINQTSNMNNMQPQPRQQQQHYPNTSSSYGHQQQQQQYMAAQQYRNTSPNYGYQYAAAAPAGNTNTTTTTTSDTWNNWEWGEDEDISAPLQAAASLYPSAVAEQQQQSGPPPGTSVMSSLGDSFTTDETWNWSVPEESRSNKLINVPEQSVVPKQQQQNDHDAVKQGPFQFNNQSSVNLETLPDNSEHPDYTPSSATSSNNTRRKNSHHWSPAIENNETVAPINDRNQYLETGHLLSEISRDGNEINETGNDMPLPPPGLQRMIPGSLNDSGQGGVGGGASTSPLGAVGGDPPPGLSRLVLGQNETSLRQSYGGDTSSSVGGGPPEGLHRMIPGESSSPETSLMPQHHHHHYNQRHNQQQQQQQAPLAEISHQHRRQPSNGPRSATIGGSDTPSPPPPPPPLQQSSIVSQHQSSQNSIRSEITSGNADGVSDGSDTVAAVAGDSGGGGGGAADFLTSEIADCEYASVKRKTSLNEKNSQESYRREAVEGHNNDLDTPSSVSITNLTNSIRNLTVGNETNDNDVSNDDNNDDNESGDRQHMLSGGSNQQYQQSSRRHSRQEESSGENTSDRKQRHTLRGHHHQHHYREKRSSVERDGSKPPPRGGERTQRGGDNEKAEGQRYKDYNRYSPDMSAQDRRRHGGGGGGGSSRRGHNRDRRYEDDTDYYSDRDRGRMREEEKDYERKYNSLRKEKDNRSRDYRKESTRDHQQRMLMMERDREYRVTRHRRLGRDDYYSGTTTTTTGGGGGGGRAGGGGGGPAPRFWNGSESIDNNRSTSRPSSRSDSLHESSSYRGENHRHHRDDTEKREQRRHKREKEKEYRNRSDQPRIGGGGGGGSDVFNPYQNYSYDPYNPYYQQYQYYENLRRTNPQAYAEWYRKYYQQQQHATTVAAAAAAAAAASTAASVVSSSFVVGDERASVHSGRSSANDELIMNKDSRYAAQSFYNQSSSFARYYGVHNHSSFDNNNSMAYEPKLKSYPYETTSTPQPQRLTPSLFTCAHMRTTFINGGKLLRILPNYPTDGESAIVELHKLHDMIHHGNDDDFNELTRFPGPLIKGVTHKKQILEYCDSKIKGALLSSNCQNDDDDADSYILMWEFLILLIRQNGVVVGTDIAELLLKNTKNNSASVAASSRPPSVYSTNSNSNANIGGGAEKTDTAASDNLNAQVVPSETDCSSHIQSQLTEAEITLKFREYLLYGSCKEALEWAMKHGLWGHALFLASKLDKRTYASVMMRFANGLPINDPLQTLYQLLSGKIPAVVTCVSDEKWGEWRPHLAMIISNSTHQRTADLNRKAITQLGDTLYNRGSNCAAQFCYLIAEVEFGKHEDQQTKMVLLGADHRKPYPYFVTNEAIHMTEIYEYACSLNDQQFAIDQFQFYKYMLATRLADYGYPERALLYLEKLADYILLDPTKLPLNTIEAICQLADQLKFYDLIDDDDDDENIADPNINTNRPDKTWLKELRDIQNTLNAHEQQTNQSDWPQQQQSDYPSPILKPTSMMMTTYQQDSQQQRTVIGQHHELDGGQLQQQQLQNDNDHQSSYAWGGYENQSWPNQDSQPLIDPQQQQQSHQQINNYNNTYENLNVNQPEPELNKDTVDDFAFQGNLGSIMTYEYKKQENEERALAEARRTFEMKPLSDFEQKQDGIHPKPQDMKTKQQIENKKAAATGSGGWLGGIFSKLSMKPKNQMILPDDKNPKIVWDADKKRWINVDEDANEAINEFKPPPKMSEMFPQKQQPQPDNNMNNYYGGQMNNNAVEEAAVLQTISGTTNAQIPSTNIFKLPKGGRNLKNSYVNVFKQNGATTTATTIAAAAAAAAKPSNNNYAQQPTNFFIPQPISDPNAPIDFITPGGSPRLQSLDQQQLQN